MEEVELCDKGLLEIGVQAFNHCKTLKRIKIPSTVTTIGDNAFSQCNKMEEVVLGEGLESIGQYAFATTRLTQLRIPPLITAFPSSMFSFCRTIFSVEFSESVMQIQAMAFVACHFLRNIALSPDAEIVDAGILQVAHFIYAQTYCNYLIQNKISLMH